MIQKLENKANKQLEKLDMDLKEAEDTLRQSGALKVLEKKIHDEQILIDAGVGNKSEIKKLHKQFEELKIIFAEALQKKQTIPDEMNQIRHKLKFDIAKAEASIVIDAGIEYLNQMKTVLETGEKKYSEDTIEKIFKGKNNPVLHGIQHVNVKLF